MRFILVVTFFVGIVIPNVASIDYIRAVSIGGHLVPEPFIVPDMWETISTNFCPNAKDIWNICSCTSQNTNSGVGVRALIKDHLSTFINITELGEKITKTKINAVRYPISFTYFLDYSADPTSDYYKYTSCGVTQSGLDGSSFKAILVLMKQLGVRVILDLHQVQGCQNGFDNGGHAGVKEFYTPDNINNGITIWKNLIKYLTTNNLLQYIWGFEILNEPLPDTASDQQLLQQFTETVVSQVLLPVLSPSSQIVVLQPGPGNSLVSLYQSYNLPSSLTYLFDFHEYIVFPSSLTLTTMGAILPQVTSLASSDHGASRWPYIVGEWSLATTDCAQYLNGAFGGFDPDYYEKQHQSRNSFSCNDYNQMRDGFTVGFQTCSVVRFVGDAPPSYGHCDWTGGSGGVWNQYRGAVCKLFATWVEGFKGNGKNVGFAFWTFTTGAGMRRIQQWDYSWVVNQGIVSDAANPTPVSDCDSLFPQ